LHWSNWAERDCDLDADKAEGVKGASNKPDPKHLWVESSGLIPVDDAYDQDNHVYHKEASEADSSYVKVEFVSSDVFCEYSIDADCHWCQESKKDWKPREA
jgi:hypothetical protein